MNRLSFIRCNIRNLYRVDELQILHDLNRQHGLEESVRASVATQASRLVTDTRNVGNPGLMEVFLAEYGLSTSEGVALMCLAEALLRVPDDQTIDELIDDKISPAAWGEHLGKSNSSLVNASTWALMLTGKVLNDASTDGVAQTLHAVVRRLGEPVIRSAVKRAMKEMGHQFVLGENIAKAIARGQVQEQRGYTYSYDMLGEAALTQSHADEYFRSYAEAIQDLSDHSVNSDSRKNPGISVKLSAIHPRYEVSQKDRVISELVPRVMQLALLAKEAQMGFNIDAEEADRLDLSLDVIEAVLRSPELAGWDGFGVVVQAYGKRCSAVLDWLYQLAEELDRNIMVRLVKGAYWDTEIKQSQVDGVADFPVFTNKLFTDISYICCAKKLFTYADRIYPQFATHNAHTVCAILEMAGEGQAFEFQRLHGMGEALYKRVVEQHDVQCRIYAPVGEHRDLLAYLVRRLLENGANSSFVNQMVDEAVSPDEIAADPFLVMNSASRTTNRVVVKPADLYLPERKNSSGWDLRDYDVIDAFHKVRDTYKTYQWVATPLVSGLQIKEAGISVYSPGNLEDCVGKLVMAEPAHAELAIANAKSWSESSAEQRHQVLNKAADLYEENAGELFAILCREAGKTASDAIDEIREAVDFLRFYAAEATRLDALPARGIFTCISPWNFPLAIFTGQLSAALAAGNGVLAKPADPTPIIASIGVRLLHEAGVPKDVLQFIPGKGSVVGALLAASPRVHGICFTGSTGVAQLINRNASMAMEPDATFIAETGGLNAMIVDSTALPEQAIQDVVDSAFRSCGQRCSALRILYLQDDVADEFMEMLYGAMDELEISNPWSLSSDIGPIISKVAHNEIDAYIQAAELDGTLLKQLQLPDRDSSKGLGNGYFIGPAVIRVDGIRSMHKEIFGPVLHVARFASNELDSVIDDINDSQYGLTFGIHTRIDDRVAHVTSRLNVGNLYVNRNQIGAIVGSQPFGGEGLSGTGPKAGGPHYVDRFKRRELCAHEVIDGRLITALEIQSLLDSIEVDKHLQLNSIDLPGPTGESNRLMTYAKGTVMCLGPTIEDAELQIEICLKTGCVPVCVVPGINAANALSGFLPRELLTSLIGIDAVALWSTTDDLASARQALACREGVVVPLIATSDMESLCITERQLCVDTTAAGGNVSLLAAQ